MLSLASCLPSAALTQAVSIFTFALARLLCVLATRDSSRKQQQQLPRLLRLGYTLWGLFPGRLSSCLFPAALHHHQHQHCCNCKLICRLSFVALHHPLCHTPHASLVAKLQLQLDKFLPQRTL